MFSNALCSAWFMGRRCGALLEAAQRCFHQPLPVGRQDGHMVSWLVVQLIGAASAEDHLLSPPASPATTAATNEKGKKGMLSSFSIITCIYEPIGYT